MAGHISLVVWEDGALSLWRDGGWEFINPADHDYKANATKFLKAIIDAASNSPAAFYQGLPPGRKENER